MHGTHPLRATADSNRYAVGVGVHDALTARIAQRAGFDVVWLSSLEVSAAKGLPDANLINVTEIALVLKDIRRAVDIPIIVDADNGYGSDEMATRAAYEFRAAGADAICIEDNMFPKRCSFYRGLDRVLEDEDDFCKRVTRIKHELGDDVEVVARTESLVAGEEVDSAVRRASKYVDAGADGIFVQTKERDTTRYRAVLQALHPRTSLIATPTALPDTRAEELHEYGIDIIIFSNAVVRAVVQSLVTTLAELRAAERLRAVDRRLAPLDDLFALTAVEKIIGVAVGPGG